MGDVLAFPELPPQHAEVVADNERLMRQLALQGKQVVPWFVLQCAVETLFDFLTDDDTETLQLLQLAVDKKMNEKLREVESGAST